MMQFLRTAFRAARIRTLVWAGALLAPFSIAIADQHEGDEAAKTEPEPTRLTLENVLSGDKWSAKGGPSLQWLPDGRYTTLEQSELHDSGKDVVLHDPDTNNATVIVRAADLIPIGGSSPLPIESYTLSADLSKLLLYTNSRKVWRARTRGDYWLMDRSSRELRQLGGTEVAPATLMFAEFSPDGRKIAYVRERNLYVQDTVTLEIKAITTTGSDTIVNGTFDWVYEEEFRLRKGFRWSPDSQWLAFWRIDDSGVRTYPLVNMTDGLYPEIRNFAYPKTGQVNPACHILLAQWAGDQEPLVVPVPGDPRDNYIAGLDWSPLIAGAAAPHLIVSQLNRKQNTLNIYNRPEPDAALYPVITDTDDAWIDLDYSYLWLEDGRFLWLSESSGWRRANVSTTAGDSKPITPEGMDVIKLLRVIPAENEGEVPLLYFVAAPGDPTRRYLYSVRVDGTDARRITPQGDTYKGTNSYDISPDGARALYKYSSLNIPTRTSWIKLPSHETIETVEENAELAKTMEELELPAGEMFRIDIGDGVALDGWCLKPKGFDPGQKYPVLFHVYGEPASQSVLDRWSRGMWHRFLAQEGYIIMKVDNRGTPAPRGREWRKSVYGQIGILASADQAAALTALLKERPYMDPERIGIWGTSGGGSMSLNAIFRYPDLYKMAMAVSFISNQRYYDTIYQERYMGLPDDNPEGYINGSPITFAHQLKGDLLLVYGTGDDNTHYQNCEALVDELVAHNKHFSLMAYPNRSHSLGEGRNTRRHYYETLTRFVMEKLPANAVSSE